MLPWERDFLAGAFAAGVDYGGPKHRARGNGKSALVAAIAAAAVAGPLAVRRGECIAVASSFLQAKIIFRFIAVDFLSPVD